MHAATVLTLLVIFCNATAASKRNATEKIFAEEARKFSKFLSKYLAKYDSRTHPNMEKNEPTVVEVELYIIDFDEISEVTMDYSLHVFLRQYWKDPRLAHPEYPNTLTFVDLGMIQKLWVPDLFISNEKNGHFHEVTVPNRHVRIQEDGSVLYSARLTLRLSCPMILHNFPLDDQNCDLRFESYGYTTDDVIIRWRKPTAESMEVQIDANLQLAQFYLKVPKVRDCSITYSTGNFSCIGVNFHLMRKFGYYFVQIYVPTVLIVILSWVSFWIDINATPGRTSLGILTVLTMTTQASNLRDALPRVSYVKAIDVWLSACLIFVFAALLEFAVVNYLCRHRIRRKEAPSLNQKGYGIELDLLRGAPISIELANSFRLDPVCVRNARRVDYLSRMLFPFVFLLFNLCYWMLYFSRRHDWTQ